MNIKNNGLESNTLREYKIIIEQVSNGNDPKVVMHSVYSQDGGYVGSLEDINTYFGKGILPELANPENKVCSIGKSYIDGKWYGWSHRAMYGFQIGDIAKEGDICTESGWIPEYLAEHPEKDRRVPVGFEAKTEEDAKRMAVAFAESVS
ncbi:MAG: hypothetical protein IPO40_24485 [Fibrobacteres bacterium]|nr:hypothetical protein [Fibrobacterota bacterium]